MHLPAIYNLCTYHEVVNLLTEETVERSFRTLFQNSEFGSDALEKADQLLDELRAESPLRHRLEQELDELKQLAGSG